MPRQITLRPTARILVRWPLGTLLVAWRYLWLTTPLHRTEEVGDLSDLPPELPRGSVDELTQRIEDGVGLLWHRRFHIRIEASPMRADEVLAAVAGDLNAIAPTETAVFRKTKGRDGELTTGDEYVVHMPGPWDGPVRVVNRTATSFRLATLRGHLEAGQVEFRADPASGALQFTIETWNRAGGRLVDFLYTRLGLAKEIQLNMWVRCCLGVARTARGTARGGVTIRTRRVDYGHIEGRAAPVSG